MFLKGHTQTLFGNPTEGIAVPILKLSSGNGGMANSGGTIDFYKGAEAHPLGRIYTANVYSGNASSIGKLILSSYFNESSAFTNITYYNDPTNRTSQVNDAGYAWDKARSSGNQFAYDLNDASENVRIFRIGYNTGDVPVSPGAYPANTLFKTTHINEEGKKVVEYTNKAGQVILTETKSDDAPSASHDGWICVYNIYDEFGLLRYRLQPEAVNFLSANKWSFSAAYGQLILNELCFRYEYDEKGRNTLK